MMTRFNRFGNRIVHWAAEHSAVGDWGAPVLVFLLALWPRLAHLGTFITYDEYDQLSFAAQFLRSVLAHDWANALVLGYPGVPTMALGALGIWLKTQWGAWHAMAPATLFASPVAPAAPPPDVTAAGHRVFLPLVLHQPSPLAPFDHIAATITQQPLAWLSAARWPLIVVSAVMVMVIFLLLRRLTGAGIAFGAMLLIAFNPLFLALSKIIHVDSPLSYFMFASFVAFVLYLQEGKTGVLALSGLFGALAVLSKTPALALGPILLLTGLVFIWLAPAPNRKLMQRRVMVSLVGWGVVAVIAFFIFWPAMWTRPLFALNWIFQNIIQNNQQTRSGSGVFWGYFGSDRNPLYYTYAFPFRWTPLTTAGVLAGIGMVVAGFKERRAGLDTLAARYLPLVVSLLGFVLMFVGAISIISRRSARYSLPAMFPLELLAMFGLVWLAGHVSRIGPKTARRWLKTGLVAGAILWQLAVLVRYQPYYYTYFNPLLGGYRTAPKLVNMGLGEGLDTAARYLNRAPNAATQTTAAWFHRQFEPYYAGRATQIFDVADVVSADHTVFYITQLQLGFPTKELLAYFADRRPEKVITLGGVDYVWIYPGPIIGDTLPDAVPQVVERPLNGHIVLRGLDVSAPDNVFLPLTLFWQTVDTLPPDLNVSVRLEDAAGEVWGQIDRLPIGGLVRTQNWQAGAVVRDEYRLPLNPATPPGTYFLSVQMYNFSTGEVFGLANRVAQVTLAAPAQPASAEEMALWLDGASPVDFGDDLTLAAETYRDFETLPGYRTTFKLIWRADADYPAPRPLTLLARPAAGGEDIPLADIPLGPESYPPAQWRRGQWMGQTVSLRIPADVPPGRYTLLAQSGGAPAELGGLTVAAQTREFSLPPDAVPAGARFGANISLAGRTIDMENGALALTLYWQTDRLLDDDLKVFVHITDPDGNIIAQRDSLPAGGARPTLTWVPGEIIADGYAIPVDAADFSVWVGLYNPLTGARLAVDGGGLSVSDNRLELGHMTDDE